MKKSIVFAQDVVFLFPNTFYLNFFCIFTAKIEPLDVAIPSTVLTIIFLKLSTQNNITRAEIIIIYTILTFLSLTLSLSFSGLFLCSRGAKSSIVTAEIIKEPLNKSTVEKANR